MVADFQTRSIAMNRFVQSTFSIALFLSACPLIYSQDSGAITGRITDPTGAVVPNAAVTVTQTDLNYQTQTLTNADGLYRVLSLRPGPYRVSVVAPGFSNLVREGISLRTDETMDLDLALKVGAANESVDVTGAATLLQTETSSTGVLLNGDYVNDLPIYQRRELSVLYFTPNVSMSYTSNGVIASLGSFSINGLPKAAMGYFEDGVQTTQPTIMGSVDEIKVVSTVPPAEFGHAGGGYVTVVKKFGSNQFHGVLSEFGRTRIMSERKYFDEYRQSQVVPGVQPVPNGYFQQYPEGNISGPVYIPKIYNGKNKTFFMVTFQMQQESQFHETPFTVPDANELAGNFGFGGIGQQIYDPRSTSDVNGVWSRTPYPNRTVPQSAWSPVAAKILSFNPFRPTNSPGSYGTTGPSNNVFYAQDARQFIPQWAARLDQQWSSNVKTFVSWSWYKTGAEPERSGTVSYWPFDSDDVYSPSWNQTYASGTTWVITPTLLAELHLGYVRNLNITQSPASFNQNIAGELGIPNLPATAFPLGLYSGIGNAAPSSTSVETLSVRPDISKVYGRHTIKAGYELLRFREDAWTVGTPDGTYSLDSDYGVNSNGVATPNTGNSFAGFLTGGVDSATFTTRLQASLPRAWQNSFYIQDDWKVSPSITVNVGVRYSLETAPTQKYGWGETWNPTAIDPNSNNYSFSNGFTCPSGGCLGAYVHSNQPYWHTYPWNIDPRLGIAWHAMPKLVLRAGFGKTMVDNRFTYLDTDEEVLNTVTQGEPAGVVGPLYYIQQGPLPIHYPTVRSDGSVPYAGVPTGHSATWFDSHLKNPYTMAWNMNVQYELSKNYVLSGIYSGSSSVDLTGTEQVNVIPYGYDLNNLTALTAWVPVAQYSRPWPNWGNISYIGNFGHADYHSGTISLEKRLSGGLNFTAFYTYSKAIDNGSAFTQYICNCLDKAVSNFNNKNLLSATSTYQLPVGLGRHFLNKKGWKDYILGGYNLTLNYSIRSGGPLSQSLSGAPTVQYPSFVANYGNVILYRDPQLRSDWKDLGGNRFNQAFENNMLNCNPTSTGAALNGNLAQGQTAFDASQPCFSYIPSYGMGNDGRDIINSQRIIAFAFSATKEILIKERARVQIRYDFQNPFKWYTLNAPTTALALGSPTLYGKVSLDAGTANLGGQPLMNLGFALMW
jgi:hypothetical protein